MHGPGGSQQIFAVKPSDGGIRSARNQADCVKTRIRALASHDDFGERGFAQTLSQATPAEFERAGCCYGMEFSHSLQEFRARTKCRMISCAVASGDLTSVS